MTTLVIEGDRGWYEEALDLAYVMLDAARDLLNDQDAGRPTARSERKLQRALRRFSDFVDEQGFGSAIPATMAGEE